MEIGNLSKIACTLGVSPSLVSRYCEGYIFGVFEDLKFKISEGSDQGPQIPQKL